ncbi:transglutaminase-like cysteine peptidase [Bradyrhizobium sp. 155]|uniref:transglutaminase-like cysteine peptidase n=1 Tax=Bradyrhizobium sp. 155 TaxID=2782629 RepID=UPI001FFE3C23|nr:transglutaminase-like cysteine peptidase [Bradyrhizobium sp. 155]UPK10290.1 transglutaminase-like cysteine peptidase [Bradyrhizobium sp. 155]
MIRHAARMLVLACCVSSRPAYSDFDTQEVVPPLSFTLFCTKYPEDCQEQQDLRITGFRSRGQRWRELNQINSIVNSSIASESLLVSRNDYEWQIFPYDGNCGDYAVTKRHLLLQAGWPTSSLLLAEVVIRNTGEHHLILLVREGRVSFVLDNLSGAVVQLNEASDQYVFLRTQSGLNPQLWMRGLARS